MTVSGPLLNPISGTYLYEIILPPPDIDFSIRAIISQVSYVLPLLLAFTGRKGAVQRIFAIRQRKGPRAIEDGR
jgi:hypothetical protein